MTLADSSHSAAQLAHLRPCPPVIWSPSLPPFVMCTDLVGGKEKGTTHLPGEGQFGGDVEGYHSNKERRQGNKGLK